MKRKDLVAGRRYEVRRGKHIARRMTYAPGGAVEEAARSKFARMVTEDGLSTHVGLRSIVRPVDEGAPV